MENKITNRLSKECQIHSMAPEIQNERLQNILISDKHVDPHDLAPLGYFVFTCQSLISEVNFTGSAFLGTDRHNLLNCSFREFVAPDNIDIWNNHLLDVLNNTEKQTCEISLIKKGGYSIYVRLDSIRLQTSDEKTKIFTAMSDLTARRILEDALKESHRQLEETLTNLRETQKQVLYQKRLLLFEQLNNAIKHEINNSPTPVIGYVDILKMMKN